MKFLGRFSGWYPVLIFAALLLPFFSQVFFQGKILLNKAGDLHLFYYSLADYFRSSMNQGVLPLWNPFCFSGYAYGADALSNVNLLNWMAWAFNDTNLAWNTIVILNIFLAALFAYLYMARMGYSGAAGVITGIAFGFSPSARGYLDAWGFFIPLILWLIEEYRRCRKPALLLLCGLALSVMVLNVNSQYCFYAGIFFVVYTVYRLRSTVGIWLLVFSLGTVSFYIFRMFEALQLSPRGKLWFVNVLLPPHLIKVFFPSLFESPFYPEINFFFAKIFFEATRVLFHMNNVMYINPPYIGILGITAVFMSGREGGLCRFYRWTAWLLLAYLMTFPLLAPLYKQLPIISQMPRVDRLGVIFTFVLSVLAGIGIKRGLENKAVPKAIAIFYGFLCLGVVGFLVATRAFFYLFGKSLHALAESYVTKNMIGNPAYKESPDFYLRRANEFFTFVDRWTDLTSPSVWLPLILIALTLGLLLIACARHKRWAIGALILLLSAAIFIYQGLRQYYATPKEMLRPQSPALAVIQNDKEIFRIMPILEDVAAGEGRDRHILSPNLNLLYRLSSVEGYDPLFSGRYAQFIRVFQKNFDKDPALILAGPEDNVGLEATRFLNVKYFITPVAKRMSEKFPLLAQDAYVRVYLNPSYYPRAFLADDYRAVKDGKEALRILADGKIDMRHQVLLEEPLSLHLVAHKESFSSGKVVWERYEAHDLELNVRASENRILVLSENYYPGWQAYLDGNLVHTFRANQAFRAIEIPAGFHRVRFHFNPGSYRWGIFMSILFALLGTFWCFWYTNKFMNAERLSPV